MSSDKRLLLAKDKRLPLVIGSLLVETLVIGGLWLSVIECNGLSRSGPRV